MKRRSVLAIPAIAALSSLRGHRAFAADKIRVGMLKPNIVTVIYWIAVKTGAFTKNGLDVVAIHHHMTNERPMIIFLHYWGIGPTDRLAAGFKATRRNVHYDWLTPPA